MKDKLIKEINKICFSEFSSIKNIKELLPITKDSTNFDIDCIREDVAYSTADISSHSVIELCSDLINLNNGSKYEFISGTALEVLENKQKLQYKFDDTKDFSKVTNEVTSILANLSKNACFVGGCVRDGVRGIRPKDADFCTDTPMKDLVDTFKAGGFKCDEVGLQFLVLVVSKDSPKYVRRIK